MLKMMLGRKIIAKKFGGNKNVPYLCNEIKEKTFHVD
jgi:hypothetical protein